MTRRYRPLAALAALLMVGGLALLASPAQAAPARPAHTPSAYCQFSDGAAAEIDATWFDGGRSVLEQVYRTASGGADLEVTYNHKGSARGPLVVVVTDSGGARCEHRLS